MPAELLKGRIRPTLIIEKADEFIVIFLTKRQKIDLAKWFCKRCFFAWAPNSENPPDRCRNTKGYLNEYGLWVDGCASRQWDSWADDFDPATCTSKRALSVYYKELGEAEEEALAAKSKNPETETDQDS